MTFENIMQLAVFIVPIITSLVTWFARGRWDDKRTKVKAATEEVNDYHALIKKMQGIITELNVTILEIKQENSDLKDEMIKLKDSIESVLAENRVLKVKLGEVWDEEK